MALLTCAACRRRRRLLLPAGILACLLGLACLLYANSPSPYEETNANAASKADAASSSSSGLRSSSSSSGSPSAGQHVAKMVSAASGLWNSLVRAVRLGPARPGDGGAAVVVPAELAAKAKATFAENQFNLVASDLMALNRSLPDYRMSECQAKLYPDRLPTTSVVIVFHNEAWSTLLRTVHSVMDRSCTGCLKEIILVDDFSTRPFLAKPLDEYVATLAMSTRVLRMPARSGLIRARLRGASVATGDTITFLDAHCEATIGWLEPLLTEIKQNRRSVVCPIIDVISEQNFQYVPASDGTWGGFNWRLNFRWYPVPQREYQRRKQDRSLPLHTPTMAGGLFTIDRKFFYEIGAYDPGMDIWGGENLEMSFRVWMCGGRLLLVTCSHVGHVFRKVSPYSWPGGVANILNKNTMRTALVWMDTEHQNLLLRVNPGMRSVSYGDVTDRLRLKKRLNCKSFGWYLENVYPESHFPSDAFYLGPFENKRYGSCVDTMGRQAHGKLGLGPCHGQGGNQLFAWSSDNRIRSDDLCWSLSYSGAELTLETCDASDTARQLFAIDYGDGGKRVRHASTGLCLAVPVLPGQSKSQPAMMACNGFGTEMLWRLDGFKKRA